jgi:predicted metal-dependent phosphoesterase TrpH/glycosyltransferase involved in cell wall biosynthesis
MRVCLVTPFAWSVPHEVNDHVAGVAVELRNLGHTVTVLAPSSKAADLREGRRSLADGADAELIALGPSVPISRRTSMGLPVGARANLTIALTRGDWDVVHGFDPGLPSLSYLALRHAHTISVASFFSAERLGYPPGKAQRERLLGRIDALVTSTPEVAKAAAERFPGDYRVVSPGVDTSLFHPGRKRRLIVLEWRGLERPLARSVIRMLDQLPGWELVVLRTRAFSARPYVPRRLAGRVHSRLARDAETRAALLAEASIFVPALEGSARLALEADAAGAAPAAPPHRDEQPELAGAAVARLAEHADVRSRLGAEARRRAEDNSFAVVAAELDTLYRGLARRRRSARRDGDPLAGRPWILCDLHMHTEWSPDCSIPVPDLIDHAEAIGLGAIAITDHNRFGGAAEAAALARGRRLTVIPAEEVKTDRQGEVIGLFLEQEIPRGLSFADTIAAIRAQGGLVYLPHPFDRRHAIPDPRTLHRHLADIDVFEVYNARLLRESFNAEALRFARKYDLTMGAGSDAHVLQGVGTGAVRMRAFNGPEEFLVSLSGAEILRRPKSLVYLQSLKWVAQAKERVR